MTNCGQVIIRYSSDEATLQRTKMCLGKLNLILVQVHLNCTVLPVCSALMMYLFGIRVLFVYDGCVPLLLTKWASRIH